MTADVSAHDEASQRTVELGNDIADTEPDAHIWDIADGLLAGAVQYWLYSRQPCGDPACEDCGPICTSQRRLAELTRLVREYSESSDYFHAPTDLDVGRA